MTTLVHTQVNPLVGKVCCLSNGCPESRIDSYQMLHKLAEAGWDATYDYRKADLILFYACGLVSSMKEDCLNIIENIKGEKNESARLIVWGCLTRIDTTAIKQDYTDLNGIEIKTREIIKTFRSNPSIERISSPHLVPQHVVGKLKNNGFASNLKRLIWRYCDYLNSKFDLLNNNCLFIKVATGCAGNCTFCSIRKARGIIQSQPLATIITELREGLRKGFKYFNLLGTDLGAYGIDLGYNLATLLKNINEIEHDFKIGLRNVNPFFMNKMVEELIPIFRSGKVYFLGSAVESGSNRILKLMNRHYTVEGFKKSIQSIQKVSPSTIIRTQMIVGFPTETNEDFEDSLHLLDVLTFDYVEVYKCCPMSGTPAATMEGQVSQDVIDYRFRKLILKYIFQRPMRKVKRLWLTS